MNNIELTVIMPFYNEEQNASTTVHTWIEELGKLNISFKLAAYNDGSKDNTGKVLHKLERDIPELTVIDKENTGHGPTILSGYRENLNSKWIFQTDSDNELPASSFPDIWLNRHNYDFLIGIRKNRQSPLSRKIITGISRLVVTLFYGRGVHDVNSPYRLMRSSFLRSIVTKIPENTFAPNVIISGLAVLHNLRIYNTPVPHTPRQMGEVSIKKWKLLMAALTSFRQTILFRYSLNK
ncbi:MAG: glycosyltransferase family 2 protein [Bacteriovoracaceae bacterium]|nr:glycosyltransferase family 2 protein [Bacteriovoracaceae bacterium]